MKFRFACAAVATLVAGLVVAQTPTPTPAVTTVATPVIAIPPAPKPKSTAWVLMDYNTGLVLAGEHYDKRIEPASITKVMTSYVLAAELANGKIKPTDDVMLSERAWREGGASTDGSFSGFAVNRTAKLIEMEKGMAVQSGNDAAIALAEHTAGSQEAFAALMNSYASKIGMKNSHFVNAHGLSAAEHYSTAYDLARLGQAFIRDYPQAYAYNKIKEYTVGAITQPNRNLLLWRDPSVDGIKTGHHSGAGYCLMSSALRGEQRLLAVVLGSTSEERRADDSLALLNWGFRFYETHRLYAANQAVAQPRVWKGTSKEVQLGLAHPLLIGIPRGRYQALAPVITIPKTLVAPIAKGQAVGAVKVSLDGKVIAEAPLIALNAVEEGGFFRRLWDGFWMWWEAD